MRFTVESAACRFHGGSAKFQPDDLERKPLPGGKNAALTFLTFKGDGGDTFNAFVLSQESLRFMPLLSRQELFVPVEPI